MRYYRIHTADNAYRTGQPRGIFTTVGKLVDSKTLTEDEEKEYWKNREYFEKVKAFTDALNEMREYEKSHDIQKRPMEEMTFYANHADEFAQKFLGGYFKKKTTTQTFM